MLTISDWREHCSAATASMADEWAARVRGSMAQTILVTGQALREMKPMMPKCFEAWWRAELGLKDRKTVSDLMTASQLLEAQPPDTLLAQLPARTLAVLQRAGAGAAGVAAERLADGERVTEAEAKRIAAPPKRSFAAGARCFGMLNDERSATLASLIKGRKAAMEQVEHLHKALMLDRRYAGMTGDQLLEAVEAGDSNPLLLAWKSTVTDVFRLADEAAEFRRWMVENPASPPAIDDPCWANAGMDAPDVFRSLQSMLDGFRQALVGHRDPEAALAAWLSELATPRGREATLAEQVMASVADGWDAWIRVFLAEAITAGQAHLREMQRG